MNSKINRLLRLSMIGAIALAAGPTIPTVALADGGGTDRCAGAAIIGDARIEPGANNFYAGYVDLEYGGYFHYTCVTAAGMTEEGIDCGPGRDNTRFVYAELRRGVLYVDCY